MMARGEPDRSENPTEGPDIEAICLAFEKAWRASHVRSLEEYLQRFPNCRSASAFRRLLTLEMNLRKSEGAPIYLADFQRQYPQHLRDVEFAYQLHQCHHELSCSSAGLEKERELGHLLDRYLADVQAGRNPDRAELLTAHPEIASQLDACLMSIDLIHRAGRDNALPGSIGRYQLQDTLGEGAFGRVFLARDPELDRLVALKIPHVAPLASNEELDKFQREARTAAQLDHEGIVTIYDVFREGEQVVIVQQYVEGADLSSYLATSERPSFARCATILLGITEAVSAAHERGFVHRDLKPSNILLDRDGKPHVADFGLAIHRSISDLYHGEKSGTPQYMSPEQVRGDMNVLDQRSDIWSLGVVLYELLVGQRPFQGRTAAELFDQIQHMDPIPPRAIDSRIPEDLEKICLKCLGKQVDQRYRSAVDLAVDLRSYLERQLKQRRTTSIAVLPFADVSRERDQAYFCDGMTEELISRLCRLRDLSTVSRTSVLAFKDSPLGAQAIGEQLNVDAILEGSVRKLEGRLRITAALISVADGFVLWSERFDRDTQGVFGIQDEIAYNIVRALKLTLSAGEQRFLKTPPTKDAQAYDYYLRGRKFFYQYRRKVTGLALRMFSLAIEHDPNYALAYAGIADCYCFLAFHSEFDSENLQRAEQASLRALELAPDSPEAHTSRGNALSALGRHDEAQAEFETALQLGSHLFDTYYLYARDCFGRGKLEKAIQLYQRACEINPQDYQAPLLLAQCYERLGRAADAEAARLQGLEAAQERLNVYPDDVRPLYMGANALLLLGEVDKSLEWANLALSMEPDEPLVLYNIACICSLAGKLEEALEHLEGAVRAGLRHKGWLEHDDNLDPLREHPRFQALVSQLK